MEIEIDYDEDKEVKFWFHLLSYMSDSVSHEVRHYLADFLESELECGEFERYSHFRELLTTEKEVGRLLLNHFEDYFILIQCYINWYLKFLLLIIKYFLQLIKFNWI